MPNFRVIIFYGAACSWKIHACLEWGSLTGDVEGLGQLGPPRCIDMQSELQVPKHIWRSIGKIVLQQWPAGSIEFLNIARDFV